jgi:hypothetical protein
VQKSVGIIDDVVLRDFASVALPISHLYAVRHYVASDVAVGCSSFCEKTSVGGNFFVAVEREGLTDVVKVEINDRIAHSGTEEATEVSSTGIDDQDQVIEQRGGLGDPHSSPPAPKPRNCRAGNVSAPEP